MVTQKGVNNVVNSDDRHVRAHARRQDVGQQAEVAEQLQAECDWLEDNADQAGPFFMGTEFSLVVRRSLRNPPVTSKPAVFCAPENSNISEMGHGVSFGTVMLPKCAMPGS